MNDQEIRYDRMVENALRGVVRQALGQAADHGLPGDHHFYITFRTAHPGVDIPESLRRRYPDDMTIVLQHQFYDLDVDDEGFAVTLSFNGRLERLRIPFAAVAAFADPSVRFGLQFDVAEAAGSAPAADVNEGEGRGEENRDEDRTTPARAAGQDRASRPEEAEPDPGSRGEARETAGENIVAFDRFRKKSPSP
ncbi:MAG: hypothetical protein D6826_12075 [Alphaproteobacteria bacterium]|nr:MAG: hypothetical protein D6826_12075 [Alphaproteobacteria bacterium]